MQQGAPAAGGSVQGDAMDSSVEVSTAAKLTPEPTETPALGAPPSLDETQPEPQPELLSGTVTAGSTPFDPSVEEPAADHAAAPPVGFTVPAAEPTSQLSQMLAQFRQLQATAPEGREKMLAELPPEVRAAARVVVKLEPKAVEKLASAAVAMQNGKPLPPEAIGTAYVMFSQLPPESKAVMISHLPPQASKFVVWMPGWQTHWICVPVHLNRPTTSPQLSSQLRISLRSPW